MSDDSSETDEKTAPESAGGDAPESDTDEQTVPRLSDDGIMLFFAGIACLLAAVTAQTTDQLRAIFVFASLGGSVALIAFVVDVATDYVPGLNVHLFVGVTAGLGAALAVPDRHLINAATLATAAALVLWRFVDVRFKDAEQVGR